MADDGKNKKTLTDRASAGAAMIGKIIKIVKYLANPVIFWIAVGVVILLFIIALWGFIESMPGNALAQIRAFFSGHVDKYEVSQTDLKEICQYIEDMGYDLETYGFVESIEREESNGEEHPKGIITNVTSKYLTAYIIANKEIYNFAKDDYEKGLIVRDKSIGVAGVDLVSWLTGGDDLRVNATIEEKNDWLVVKIPFNAISSLFGTGTRYGYNLNEWTCKYGKPSEFLIALHIATGAPDFVYKLATEPEVDTKVHIELFATKAKIELLDKDGKSFTELLQSSDKTTIEMLKNSKEYNNVNELIDKLNADIKTLNDKIVESGENQLIYNTVRHIDYISEDSYNAYYLDWVGDEKQGVSGKSKQIKEFIEEMIETNVKRWLSTEDINEIIDCCNTVLKDCTELKDSIDAYVEKVKNIKVMVGDIELSKEDIEEIQKFIETYCNKERSIATPFITKVIQHWYRNQYFVLKTIDEAKAEVKAEGGNENDEDAVISKRLEGGAYELSNEDVVYIYQLPIAVTGEGEKFGIEDEHVREILSKLYVKETRPKDIIQVSNPLFEDNSYYIRSWLKEKYYVFRDLTTEDKKTTTGEQTKPASPKNTQSILDEKKMMQGKEYIDGKKALAKVRTMLENSDDRQDIKYMERDLIELLEDFEFDLENTDEPEAKVLSNVMPDYVPYTPWPSVFEEGDNNYTKMIYKTSSNARIVAPATGIIKKADSTAIEIEFSSEEDTSKSNNKTVSIVNGYTLRIEAENCTLSAKIAEGSKVNSTEEIGEAVPNNGIVTLKLYLFTKEKGVLKVEKYMSVPSKELKDIKEEPGYSELRNVMVNYAVDYGVDYDTDYSSLYGGRSESELNLARQVYNYISNIIFNRISSPYYSSNTNISNTVEYFSEFYRTAKNSFKGEEENACEEAIRRALNGIDLTKNKIPIGATCITSKEDRVNGRLKIELHVPVSPNIHDEIGIGFSENCYLYVTDKEIEGYLEPIINKKIDEVIYSLNRDKYLEGYDEYNKFAANFNKVKDEILKFYMEKGQYHDDKYNRDRNFAYEVGNKYDDENEMVTSIIKKDVSENIEEKEETGENQEVKKYKIVTDTFTFIADGNYETKFTLTYTENESGEITSEIELKHENIPTKEIENKKTDTDTTQT